MTELGVEDIVKMVHFHFLESSVFLFFALLTLGLAAYSIPDEPSYVELSVISGDTIYVAFDSPLSDGGDPIQSYEVCIPKNRCQRVQAYQELANATYLFFCLFVLFSHLSTPLLAMFPPLK